MRWNEQPQETPDDRFKLRPGGRCDTKGDRNESVALLDQPDRLGTRLVQRSVTERGALSQTKRLEVGFDDQRLDTETWADAAALATAGWQYPGSRQRGAVAHQRLTARDDVEHLLQRSHRPALCKKIRRGLEKLLLNAGIQIVDRRKSQPAQQECVPPGRCGGGIDPAWQSVRLAVDIVEQRFDRRQEASQLLRRHRVIPVDRRKELQIRLLGIGDVKTLEL